MRHGTRCKCDDCIEDRARIRDIALGRLNSSVQELTNPNRGRRHYRNGHHLQGISSHGARTEWGRRASV